MTHPVKYPFQGLQADVGFMFQKYKYETRIKVLEGYNGQNAMVSCGV